METAITTTTKMPNSTSSSPTSSGSATSTNNDRPNFKIIEDIFRIKMDLRAIES